MLTLLDLDFLLHIYIFTIVECSKLWKQKRAEKPIVIRAFIILLINNRNGLFPTKHNIICEGKGSVSGVYIPVLILTVGLLPSHQ